MTVQCVAKIGIVRCGRYYVKGICGRDRAGCANMGHMVSRVGTVDRIG